MNILRHELIKAYFEATWYDDEGGLDYRSKNLVVNMDKFLHSLGHKVDLVGSGAYIQCEEDFTPPAGFVIDGKEANKDVQVMIETDKFCNVENVYWEKI
jgi:hypothetical protein